LRTGVLARHARLGRQFRTEFLQLIKLSPLVCGYQVPFIYYLVKQI
jgi:hypothetical protein